jgi:hypothetical protein
VNFDPDAPLVGPVDIALRFPRGEQAVIVEDKLDQTDPGRRNRRKILLLEAGDQQERARIHLHPRGAQLVIAALGEQRQGEGRGGIGRHGQTGEMQLAGGDQGGDAPVQVVSDPGVGLLSRGELAKGGMGMGVDQAGYGREPPGIDHHLGRVGETVADLADQAIGDIDGVGLPYRVVEVTGRQRPDVLDEPGVALRTHARPPEAVP